jgi:hypothetical protein
MWTFTVQISGCLIGFMYMCICCFHFNLSCGKSYPNVFKCFFFAFSLQIYQFLSTFIRTEGCPQVEVGLQTQFQVYSLYFSLPLISTCEASHTILTNLANWGTLQPELRSRAPDLTRCCQGNEHAVTLVGVGPGAKNWRSVECKAMPHCRNISLSGLWYFIKRMLMDVNGVYKPT